MNRLFLLSLCVGTLVTLAGCGDNSDPATRGTPAAAAYSAETQEDFMRSCEDSAASSFTAARDVAPGEEERAAFQASCASTIKCIAAAVPEEDLRRWTADTTAGRAGDQDILAQVTRCALESVPQ